MARRILSSVVVLLLLVAPMGCAAGGGAGALHRPGTATLGASQCQVTVTNNSTPPGERPGQGYDGNGALWTALPLNGKVVGVRPELLSHPGQLPEGVFGTIRADGAIAVKFPWWGRRGESDPLTITGRRLDQSASPLRVDAPPGSGKPGFWASRIIFPTVGCWSVTGRAQAGTLTFTVRVVKANELAHAARLSQQAAALLVPTVAPSALLAEEPYIGVACPAPVPFSAARAIAIARACNRVGLSIDLRARAVTATATINGQAFKLDNGVWSDPPVGGKHQFLAGFVQPARFLHGPFTTVNRSRVPIENVHLVIDYEAGHKAQTGLRLLGYGGWG
jgi:hypothetical protein